MSHDRATSEMPSLVGQALARAEQLNFTHSCLPEVGRLLRVLSGNVRNGTIGEIGTGCGVGSAWMVRWSNSLMVM